MMSVIGRWILSTIFGFGYSGTSLGQTETVGVITYLAGMASFSPASGQTMSEARLFMKLSKGDNVTLSSGTHVRIVYPGDSRQEIWRGPIAIQVDERGGHSTTGNPEQVSKLDREISEPLGSAPILIMMARSRLEGPVMPDRDYVTPVEDRLSVTDRGKISNARKIYAFLRANASADDIAPEMFLYGVMQYFVLHKEMLAATTEMAKRQPANNDVKILLEYTKDFSQRFNDFRR